MAQVTLDRCSIYRARLGMVAWRPGCLLIALWRLCSGIAYTTLKLPATTRPSVPYGNTRGLKVGPFRRALPLKKRSLGSFFLYPHLEFSYTMVASRAVPSTDRLPFLTQLSNIYHAIYNRLSRSVLNNDGRVMRWLEITASRLASLGNLRNSMLLKIERCARYHGECME